MLTRSVLILTVALAGCVSSERTSTSDAETPIDALYGTWTFEAERPGEGDITGRFVLSADPAHHRFVIPNTPLDSLVHESRPVLRGNQFIWEGELDTSFGRGEFRVDAVVEGNTMRGTNDVPRAGRYRFVAIRTD